MKHTIILCLTVGAIALAPNRAISEILAGPIYNTATDHDYYLLTEGSWTSAEQEAVSLGGHLVTINGQPEQDWVWSTFGSYGGVRRSLWIGLNDVVTEGTFVWSSGEPVTFLNWLDGQPDNNTPAGEDYVHMMGNDRNGELPLSVYGKWNDYQNTDAAYTSYNFGPMHGVVEVERPFDSIGKDFLWQIDHGESRVYILGSIHVLRSTDRPLPVSMTQAFNQSTKVYFETDLDEAASDSVGNYVVARATYPSGQNLQSKLPPVTYTKLQNFAVSKSLPADYFRPYRPWFVIALVGAYANVDLDVSEANGVDRYFFNLAKTRGVSRAYLETPIEQFDFIANSPESELLSSLIIGMENPGGGTLPLIENWKQGNTPALARSNAIMAAQSPGIYSSIITTRNQNWIGAVTNELVGSKTTMFIVGAAHAVGEDGLPARLSRLGYSVRQLPLMPPRLLALRAFREISGFQTNEVDLPVIEGNTVSDLPVLKHSRIRLVATIENKPNVTNVWHRDGIAIGGQSGNELDLGVLTAGSNGEYHLILSGPDGQRVYNRIRLQLNDPDIPALRVAPFSPGSGFQSFVSVLAGRHYQVQVTEGLEPGGSWRWFGDLAPVSSAELPLTTLPWSEFVPRRFYRVMEVY